MSIIWLQPEMNVITSAAELPEIGRKVFWDLNTAFSQLCEIEEVGTIYGGNEQNRTNKSPVRVENNRIGIEQWAGKYLFTFAYHSFMKLLANYPLEGADRDLMLDSTRCVVLFCADCATAWNVRKRLLSSAAAPPSGNSLRRELRLAELTLRRHPKSQEAFAHRRWLLDAFVMTAVTSLDDVTREEIAQEELVMCGRAAEWHRSNYSAWSHRVWVVQRILAHPDLLLPEVTSSNSFSARAEMTSSNSPQPEVTSSNSFSARAEMTSSNSPQPEVTSSNSLSARAEVTSTNSPQPEVTSSNSFSARAEVTLSNVLPSEVTSSNSPSARPKVTSSNSLPPEVVSWRDRFLATEAERTMTFVARHVSDHSPCAYARHLVASSTLDVASELFDQTSELLALHDGRHESLWTHRRLLMMMMTQSRAKGDGCERSLKSEREFCARFAATATRWSTTRHLAFLARFLCPDALRDRVDL